MTIAHDYENGADLIQKGDAIVEKYRPAFIPEKAPGYTSTPYPVIRWCFETYPMFGETQYNTGYKIQAGDMLSHPPYGGSTVVYPNYESDTAAASHGGQAYNADRSQFVPSMGMEHPANPEYYMETQSYMKGNGLPNNRVFVLTITCNYPFSNFLVKKLFNEGVNTKIVKINGRSPSTIAQGNPGTMYLLWARGAGIVNAK